MVEGFELQCIKLFTERFYYENHLEVIDIKIINSILTYEDETMPRETRHLYYSKYVGNEYHYSLECIFLKKPDNDI